MTLAYKLSPLMEELLSAIEEAAERGESDVVAVLEEQRDRMMEQHEDPAAVLLAMGRDRRELEARDAGIKLEQDRLGAKRRHLKKLVSEIRQVALVFMDRRGVTRVETGDPVMPIVRRQKNGGKAPVQLTEGIEVSAIPGRFQRQPPPEVDMDAVRDALEAGEVLPWARLVERGEHVRWD